MNSIETGSAEFNQHIKGKDFFDTATYPKATFVGNKTKFVKGQPVAVTGKLTIKNVTKEVTLNLSNFLYLDAHPMVENKAALGANASVEILRSDFNAGMYAPYVSDAVTINLAIEAIEK